MDAARQSSQPPDAEALLAQAGWVRGLARRLVGDEGLADDVVQETWLAALERRPAGEGPGGLRAWLGAVARNLSLRARRREAVRPGIERAAARPEAVGGGQEELERLQLQKLLTDAVLALEEPYRSAIVLRYLEGLAPEDVARRQGCSPAAARQRVSRGLATLRARLERSFGDRSSWCAALAALARLGGMQETAAAVGGAIVGIKTLGAAAAAVALAALAIYLQREPAAEVERARAAELVAEIAAPAAEREGPGALRSEGGMAPSEPAQRRAVEAAAAPALVRSLEGTVTDRRGLPLEGAQVVVACRDEEIEVHTGADGAFAAELPAPGVEPGEEIRVRVEREDYVPAEQVAASGEPLAIALAALPVLAGTLRDPTGQPASPPGSVSAEVLLPGGRRSTHDGSVGAGGVYSIAGLPVGELVRVKARARACAERDLAIDPPIPLEIDRMQHLDLDLPGGAVVTGIVLDARTRAPVPGAEVWAERFFPDPESVEPTAVADGTGRFRLEGVMPRPQVFDGQAFAGQVFAVLQVTARAPDYAASPLRIVTAPWSEEGLYDIELLLEPGGCSLSARLFLPDGETPAVFATVYALDAERNLRIERTGADGRFELADLAAGELELFGWCDLASPAGTAVPPGGVQELAWELAGPRVLSFTLRARARARAWLRTAVELAPGPAEERELVLRPPAEGGIEGTLRDPWGAPLESVRVEATWVFESRRLSVSTDRHEVSTDAEGRFRFERLPPGRYDVRAVLEETPGRAARPRERSFSLELGSTVRGADYVVGESLRLAGHVEAPGLPFGSLDVSVLDARTGEVVASSEPGADGAFRFEGLFAAAYDAVLSCDGLELAREAVGPAGASGLVLRAR